MSLIFLDPSDTFLIIMEFIIVVGLSGATFFANRIRMKYPKLTKIGWRDISRFGFNSFAFNL
ncbi:MAG: hypothetical protein ACTSR2_15105 [Candidatus Hodarchaeales archaeon]